MTAIKSKIELLKDDKEEFEKCLKSPYYFYNKYVRRDGDREVSEDEFEKIALNMRIKRRVNPFLKDKTLFQNPLSSDECYKHLPDFLK